jgi:electron transfer flavoprotein alpha subunit
VSSPNLYVGVGVSGQIQHVVGIMDANLIVAINSDKNALIFKVADYGIVGDLYQVVPRLVEQLQK